MLFTSFSVGGTRSTSLVKRRFLSTRMLENGMVIDQSIIDKSGRILVARKTVLDDYMIDALRKMKISGVYIREG